MAFQHKTALLAACVLALSLTGCAAKETPAATAATESETTAPAVTAATAPVADTPVTPNVTYAVLERQEEDAIVSAWELTASRVWSSSNGADITMRAQPREYVDGQSAAFAVKLDGNEVLKEFCRWDGSCYSYTAELSAANGYEYEFILYSPDGSSEVFSMSGPYDSLVYLENSLASYCNLYIADSKLEDGKLTIVAGFANVQLPLLSPEEHPVLFDHARLILMNSGTEIDSCALELPAGEGAGSYENSLADLNISFNVPAMNNEGRLELMLEATFTNGETLTVSGGTWEFSDGGAQMNVG